MIGTPLRKVDLHVHTAFSSFRHLKFLRARDSYNDPQRVYDRCRSVGCDYVAITDHDTIDGALDLLSRRPELAPTLIIGEEVETGFPETGFRGRRSHREPPCPRKKNGGAGCPSPLHLCVHARC